mmetsp:Transcript_13530/g.41864  ORF Transcript_13530/g.41864 Transcript_13530/m.41864 type:complete len:319 (-) Transcript_13530:65-1021(-)
MVRAQLHENKGKAGRGPGPGRRDPVDARERRHGLAAGRVAGGRLPERADLALRHARAGAHGSAAGRPGRGGRRVSAECREGLPECRPAAQGPTSRVRPGARHEFEREEAAHELLVPPLRRLPFEGGLRRVRVAARRGLLQVRGRLGLLVPRAAGALRRAGLRDRLPEHEKAHHVPRVQLPIGAHGAGAQHGPETVDRVPERLQFAGWGHLPPAAGPLRRPAVPRGRAGGPERGLPAVRARAPRQDGGRGQGQRTGEATCLEPIQVRRLRRGGLRGGVVVAGPLHAAGAGLRPRRVPEAAGVSGSARVCAEARADGRRA